MRSIGVMVCALLGLGCGEPSLKAVDSDDTGDDGGSCRVDDGEHDWRCSPVTMSDRKLVDILFVIDNSGSMGEEQGRLIASIDALIEPLEAEGIDYRVGVTTTDNSNPWCGASTTPEAGALVMSSCRGRGEHFVFVNTNDGGLVHDIACTDHCDLEPEQLDALMKPIRTEIDPDAKLRPWIQSGPIATNLPDGVSGADALRCVLPQGIDGCGFESQLESMYKAVQRTKNADEDSYGFIRDGAALAIVILTDEADCSHVTKWEQIFTHEGNKVFWSDPDAQYPTSAVCWNAGVECTGGPGEYDECHAVDRGVDGAPTNDPTLAVLQPLGRYAGLIQNLQERKLLLNPNNDVMLALIAGVPEDYASGDVSGLYADTPDPVFQGDFGIGPGCITEDFETAVPPVRLREFVEDFGEPHVSSVCAQNYSPALTSLADDIEAHMPDLCYRECVRDVDPGTEGVQADCVVDQYGVDGRPTPVPPCETVDGEFVLPSDDVDVCFSTITDAASMSTECAEQPWNLEFEIVRRPGVPVSSGTVLVPTCQLSEDPAQDCPELGS